MDLSTAINRLRFDGLAAGVYSKIGQKMTSVVESASLDLCQIDEVLLAGSSTLFPGLQSHLAMLLPPSSPITTTIDPSQVIAIGCALTALHLSELEDGLKLDDVLAFGADHASCVSKPIGIVVPGVESKEMVTVLPSGAPLPARRRVVIPVEKAAAKVALELWEGKDEVKIDKVERPPLEKVDGEEDEFSDEEEEDEETKTPTTIKTTCLGGLEVSTKAGGNVVLEVIVQRGGGLEARLWEEGKESEADSFEV